MAKLMTLTKRIKKILEENEDARNSDNVLVYRVICEVGREKGVDVRSMNVSEFLLTGNRIGLPDVKSITRLGRKVKESNPQLRGCDEIEGFRAEKEEEYRSFAREVHYV